MRFNLSDVALAGLSALPLPFSLTRTAIPSCGFAPLQGVLPKDLPTTSRREHLSWEFRAVRRIRSEGVHITPVVPSTGLGPAFREFHPRRGLLLPRPCGFISPRIRPSASPFREFPSQGAAPTRRWRHAVVPFRKGRLHGFALLESPCRRRCLDILTGRAPPGFLPLQGLPTQTMRRLVTGAPPARFPRTALRSCPHSPNRDASRSLARLSSGCLSRDNQPS